MIILTIKTDQPKASIGLYDEQVLLGHNTWLAHRELSKTLHTEIDKLLRKSKKSLSDLEGLVGYAGPGSFTGLRIGFSVLNALGYSLSIPVVATNGQDWTASGIKKLLAGENDKIALPLYGAEANITKPKH